MNIISQLQLSEKNRVELKKFSKILEGMNASRHYYLLDQLRSTYLERDLARIFLLYMISTEYIQHEIKNSFSLQYKNERVHFLAEQLKSKSKDVQLVALELLHTFADPIALPLIEDALLLEDPDITSKCIELLDHINHLSAASILQKLAKKVPEQDTKSIICYLRNKTSFVNWKFYIPFLKSENPEIRKEAAFSLALQKEPKSAKKLIGLIEHEKHTDNIYACIEYLGFISSRRVFHYLLFMSVENPDQKKRYYANKSLSRLLAF